MDSQKEIAQSFIIDKLTDSVLNTISGDSFNTEVSVVSNSDLKSISKTD